MPARRVRGAARTARAGVLTALAVALHLFRIPFPLLPALKFDLSGVPLLVLASLDLPVVLPSFIIFFAGVLALSGDPIGAAMKALAEAATALPYAALGSRGLALAGAAATAARISTMCLANYYVLPYWMIWAGWARSLDVARAYAVAVTPYIALFNAIAGAYTVLLGHLSMAYAGRRA
ncbi:MAG: hypothetical protein ABWK00_03665 [Desulfurococcaceae archaeon]